MFDIQSWDSAVTEFESALLQSPSVMSLLSMLGAYALFGIACWVGAAFICNACRVVGWLYRLLRDRFFPPKRDKPEEADDGGKDE